jgi:hypothetical protein
MNLFDEQEIHERKIDRLIALTRDEEPGNYQGDSKMVEAKTEIEYCEELKTFLELERDREIDHRLVQYQQVEAELKENSPQISCVASPFKIREMQQAEVERQLQVKKQLLDEDIKLIMARFQSLIDRVERRISKVGEVYQNTSQQNSPNSGKHTNNFSNFQVN